MLSSDYKNTGQQRCFGAATLQSVGSESSPAQNRCSLPPTAPGALEIAARSQKSPGGDGGVTEPGELRRDSSAALLLGTWMEAAATPYRYRRNVTSVRQQSQRRARRDAELPVPVPAV